MPHSYTIYPKLRLVWARFWGVVGYNYLIEHLDMLQADQVHIPLMKKVSDFRDCESFLLSSREVYSVVEKKKILDRRFQDVKSAVITPAVHTFGVGLMWEALYDGSTYTYSVFRSTQDGCDWLCIDPSILEQCHKK